MNDNCADRSPQQKPDYDGILLPQHTNDNEPSKITIIAGCFKPITRDAVGEVFSLEHSVGGIVSGTADPSEIKSVLNNVATRFLRKLLEFPQAPGTEVFLVTEWVAGEKICRWNASKLKNEPLRVPVIGEDFIVFSKEVFQRLRVKTRLALQGPFAQCKPQTPDVS